jgi:hypothetical protein
VAIYLVVNGKRVAERGGGTWLPLVPGFEQILTPPTTNTLQ